MNAKRKPAKKAPAKRPVKRRVSAKKKVSGVSGLVIERMALADLAPAPYNPRKDLQPDDAEYKKIKRSVDRWGMVEPLVWNRRTGNLVGGHQRLKVLIERGDTEGDVSVVDLDAQEERALNVALNKTGGDWDMPALSELLSDLDAHGFDATLTGFDDKELEGLLTWTPDGEGDGGEAQDSDQWICAVTCTGEKDLQSLYEELSQRGYECRLIT